MEVRAAVPADREAILRLLEAAREEFGERRAPEGAVEAQVAAALAGHIDLRFLLADEGGARGILSLAVAQTTLFGGRFGFVDDVHVEPAYRGRGFATALLSAAREWGSAEGLVELRLAARNEPHLARLYERAGFEPWATWYVQPLPRDWAGRR